MAKQVVTARTILAGALDLAGNLNQADLAIAAPEVDMTNLASGGVYEGLCGIRKASLNFQGFWESAGSLGNPDAELHSNLSTTVPFTLGMNNPPVAGDVAYFVNGLETQYQLGGMIGQAARLGIQGVGIVPVTRGKFLEVVTSAATHDSASLTMPAVAATEVLALAVHVTAASGTTPTLDLVVESDEDDTYASATTRFTVPQFTGIGSYYAILAGAITDVEYRVAATIAGTDPSFTYRVALGIYATS